MHNRSGLIKLLTLGVLFIGGGAWAYTTESDYAEKSLTKEITTVPADNLVYRKGLDELALSEKLYDAEKAMGFLIEEHNRRVDMLENWTLYKTAKNHATKVKDMAQLLYMASMNCNRDQMGKACGSKKVWEDSIIPEIIGPAHCVFGTESYNSDDAYDGCGGLFDPANPSKGKFFGRYFKTTGRLTPLQQFYKQHSPNYPPKIVKTSADWESDFYPEYIDKGMPKSRMREYRKERWKIGYQLLMDIYQNHSICGNTPNKLWQDQKTRYDKEVYQPHYGAIDAWYACCDVPKRPDHPGEGEYADKGKYDYYEHFDDKAFWKDHKERYKPEQIKLHWDSPHIEKGCSYDYKSECCDTDDEGNTSCWECILTASCHFISTCCTTCTAPPNPPKPCDPHPTDVDADGTWCPGSACKLDHHFPHPQIVPKGLIWNNNEGKASLEESVYIDALPTGSGENETYSSKYTMDMMKAESPLGPNGVLKVTEDNTGEDIYQVPAAIPLAWREYYNRSINMKNTYGTDPKYDYLGTLHYYGNFNVLDLTGTNGELSRIAKKKDGKLVLRSDIGDILPMNQNRIQTFMDIHDAYYKAQDAYNKTVIYDLPKLVEGFNKGISDVDKRQGEGLYRLMYKGEKDKEAYPQNPPEYNGLTVNFADQSSLEQVSALGSQREQFYLDVMRRIADEVAAAYPVDDKTYVVPDSGEATDAVLYRLARVYKTLYYFDNNWDCKIDDDLVTVYDYDKGDCGKLERLRADGKFLSDPINESTASDYPYQISKFAEVYLIGKTPAELAAADENIRDSLKKARDWRLKLQENLCYQREQRKALYSNNTFPNTFSVLNFNTNSCLMRNVANSLLVTPDEEEN